MIVDAIVYLAIVLAIAAIGVWVGMILVGRVDRRMTPADAEPAAPPPTEEPS